MARRRRYSSRARANGKDGQALGGAMGTNTEINTSSIGGNIEAAQLPLLSCEHKAEWLPCDPEVENISLPVSLIDSTLGSAKVPGAVNGHRDQELGGEGSAAGSRTKRKASQDSYILEPSKKCKVTEESKGVPERKLACPYFKRNPSKYVTERSCSGPGWSSVHRLNRRFAKQQEYKSHRDSARPCHLGNYLVDRDDDGFNERQRDELRSKKNRQQSSEEQRWSEVYQILFPSDDPHQRPSPCKHPLFPSILTEGSQDPTVYDYKISLQDADADNDLDGKIRMVLKEKLEEVASNISNHMADSLQNISSQGLSGSTSRGKGQARQLVPHMKNELDRVCRVQHELVLDKIITEIVRIARNQQIDVSGRASDPTSIAEGKALSPKPHEPEELAMRSGQSHYELPSDVTGDCVESLVSVGQHGQQSYSDTTNSGNWQTPQRTYSGSTVAEVSNWGWTVDGDPFESHLTHGYMTITEAACQAIPPDPWDSVY